MVEDGQIWESGGRTVQVLTADEQGVVVRDAYGWCRSLTQNELEHGFSSLTGHHEHARGVMARRALADIDPA